MGKILVDLDALHSKAMEQSLGMKICQIHQSPLCDKIGVMHILSKAAHPRLRYHSFNTIFAGWFCSHYWTHHDSEDKRAQYAIKRIEEIRGKDYREKLLAIEIMQPRHNSTYLKTLQFAYKQILKGKG